MNFASMPILESAYGYSAVLALMVALPTTLLWYFHRRRWFK